MTIETSGINYMGSKKKFIDEILEKVRYVVPEGEESKWTALDVFTGTTRVGQAFRQAGFKTLTSELLWAGESYANAFICNPSAKRDHLQEHINDLNNVEPKAGWLSKNYCEVEPAQRKDPTKMVNAFTKANGRKADAIREAIENLRPELEHWEYMTLLASLVFALSKVQNSQGHSRAFFRTFDVPGSLRDIHLTLPPLVGNPGLEFDKSDRQFKMKYPVGAHFVGSVLDPEYIKFVKKNKRRGSNVIAYLDPPYTSAAQYNLFYHLWDSVVRWDKPEVVGATNRRADRSVIGRGADRIAPDLESKWTKKNEARGAFVELFEHLDFVDVCVISYSDESIMNHDDMISMFDELGYYVGEFHEKVYRRHALAKSGRASEDTKKNAKMKNVEWIFVICKKGTEFEDKIKGIMDDPLLEF